MSTLNLLKLFFFCMIPIAEIVEKYSLLIYTRRYTAEE